MPTLFIPHGGGPCFFMDWSPPDTWTRMAAFLEGLAASLPRRPTALLVVSGHWAQHRFTVGDGRRPEPIYDHYGFPPHTYQLRYDAPGAPDVADHAAALIRQAGFAVDTDPGRGFDHGVFIPLKLVFPQADIPIATLSLRADLDPAAHLAAGRALAPLREQDVLIVGSGMSFHNMRGFGDPRFGAASDAFDAWLTEVVEDDDPGRRAAALANWTEAPAARLCHPPGGEEHLIPLMAAAGAAGQGRGRRIFSDRVMGTTISGFRFD